MTYAQSALSVELEQFIGQFSDVVCCGIEWVLADSGRLECRNYYNPSWRIEAVEKGGLENLFTSKSAQYTFAPGEGLVGKTFASQKKLFVEDLQELGVEDMKNVVALSDGAAFFRAGVAKEFGFHSAIFVPTPNGVLEAGTTQKLASESEFFKTSSLPTDVFRQMSPPGPPSTVLKEIVDTSGGACYGIEWGVLDGGLLKCKSFYNPEWRIEAVQKKGLHGLYTTQSSTYTFRSGEGFVGTAFANQQILFSEDLQTQSVTEMMDAISLGDHAGFMRTELAEEFGIRSAVFMPTGCGVIEVGSTQQVKSARALLSGAVSTLDKLISRPILELGELA
jgi:hypothetical protein